MMPKMYCDIEFVPLTVPLQTPRGPQTPGKSWIRVYPENVDLEMLRQKYI